MNKYLRLIKLHFQVNFEYRANLVVWRLRNIIGLATMLMIWQAVYANTRGEVGGYSATSIYTYVLIGHVFRSITKAESVDNLQGLISSGDLNNLLLRPINAFEYILSQDIASKAFNIFFTLIETAVVYLLLAPPIMLTTDIPTLTLLTSMVPLVYCLNFLISLMISQTTFWYYQNNGWSQRFLFDLIIGFFSGNAFPLEFLPRILGTTLMLLPTSLLFYSPMQLFLGRITLGAGWGLIGLCVIWIGIFYLINLWLWRRGVAVYGAFGR